MRALQMRILAVVGQALARIIEAVGVVRGPRPIHTTGLLLTGRLRWYAPTAARSGIAWIDERPRGDVLVSARLSRGAGLPALLPDIIGLAVRPGAEGGDGDLLLSSTGIGVPGRFLLRPRWTPSRVFLSTLMPYRGANGPVLIAARSNADVLPARMAAIRTTLRSRPWSLDLMFASPAGLWHRFAELELAPSSGPLDAPMPRFDPIFRPLKGAGTYSWTRALREPAYSVARRAARSSR